MLEYAKSFYTGTKWRKLSKLYMSSINYVCERCGGVAEICHHKKYITPQNINNDDITLNWDNLEGLCMDCHNKEHKIKNKDYVNHPIFDSNGHMIGVKESREVKEFKKAVSEIDHIKLEV